MCELKDQCYSNNFHSVIDNLKLEFWACVVNGSILNSQLARKSISFLFM